MNELLKSKSFWLGAGAVVSAVGGYAVGAIDIATAIEGIMGGLAVIFLKDSSRKNAEKIDALTRKMR
jgi:hypothetical protein